MTLTDIVIKVFLFFGVFYGAIFISAFVGKKFRERNDTEEAKSNEQKQTKSTSYQ